MKKVISVLMITCMLAPMFAETPKEYSLGDDIDTVGMPNFGGLLEYLNKAGDIQFTSGWFGYAIFDRVLWDAPSEIKGLTNKQAYLFAAIAYKGALERTTESYGELYEEYDNFYKKTVATMTQLQTLMEQEQQEQADKDALYQKNIAMLNSSLHDAYAQKKSGGVVNTLIGVCIGIAVGGMTAFLVNASMGK